MKPIYAKCILYSYPNIDDIAEQIDELVEKKALSSMKDFSPALSQCEKIVLLTCQKELMFELKEVTRKALEMFSEDDLLYFEYKYFRKKKKEEYAMLDTCSRAYFRKQNKLLKSLCIRLENAGLSDKYFEENYLSIEFFRELLIRVIEYDKASIKNKGKKTIRKVNEERRSA